MQPKNHKEYPVKSALNKKLSKQLRADYQLITGNQSDRSWYIFRRTLEELNLVSPQLTDEENVFNVRKWASIRVSLPRTSVSLKKAFVFFQNVETLVEGLNGNAMSGKQIMEYLAKQDIVLPPSTRSDWFDSVGGFRSVRGYTPTEIRTVLFKACVYKAKSK